MQFYKGLSFYPMKREKLSTRHNISHFERYEECKHHDFPNTQTPFYFTTIGEWKAFTDFSDNVIDVCFTPFNGVSDLDETLQNFSQQFKG